MLELLLSSYKKAIDYVFNLDTAVVRVANPSFGSGLHIPCVNRGNTIHYLGGYAGGRTASHSLYHVNSNSVTTAANLPVAHQGATALIHNNEIYVIGGDRADSSNDFLIYNPTSNTWRRDPAPGLPMAQYCKLGYCNGKIYMPQCDGSSNYYIYDIATKTLETIAISTPAVIDKCSINVGDWVYSFGGRNARVGYSPRNNVAYRLNVITKEFQLLETMPEALLLDNGLVMEGDLIYIVGGVLATEVSSTKTHEYNTLTNTYRSATPNIKLAGHAAVSLLNGNIYVTAGRTDISTNITGTRSYGR